MTTATATRMVAIEAFDVTTNSATFTTKEIEESKAGGIAFIQEAVGGYFESGFTIPSPRGEPYALTGYVNDEGLLIRLPIHIAIRYPNGYVTLLAGSMMMQGLDTSTGESEWLTPEEVAYLQSRRLVVPVFPYQNYMFTDVAFYDFWDGKATDDTPDEESDNDSES